MKGVSHSRQIVLFGMLHFINLLSHSHFSATPPSLAHISSSLPCAGLPHFLLTQAQYVFVCVFVCEGVYGWGGERHKWALSAVRVMMQEQPKLQQTPRSPEISGCDSALSFFPHTHFLPCMQTHRVMVVAHTGMAHTGSNSVRLCK